MFGQACATGEPTTIEMMHSIDDQQWYRLALYSHILVTDYGYCFDKNSHSRKWKKSIISRDIAHTCQLQWKTIHKHCCLGDSCWLPRLLELQFNCNSYYLKTQMNGKENCTNPFYFLISRIKLKMPLRSPISCCFGKTVLNCEQIIWTLNSWQRHFIVIKHIDMMKG